MLYTDGLIEARSADGILGEERVRELLAGEAGATAEDLAGALAALAAEFGSRGATTSPCWSPRVDP